MSGFRPATALSGAPLLSLSAVVLDTETTGLDTARARIVQIGAVRLNHGEVEGEGFDRLVNPGEPIPQEVRIRLFERFYRADSSRSRDTEGAGLGLAIVKAIAEAHGGGVRVHSAGESNTFIMWLPAAGEVEAVSRTDFG